MTRKQVWIAAGLLFVALVGSGFMPDLRLDANMRKARALGLLNVHVVLPPSAADDASMLYRKAITQSGVEANGLENNYTAMLTKPSPNLLEYLKAIRLASEKPGCAPLEPTHVETAYTPMGNMVFNAGRAIVDLATDSASLVDAAHIAKHLAAQNSIISAGRWGYLTSRIFAKAEKLKLDSAAKAEIRIALGPPLDVREVLRNHVARAISDREKGIDRDGIRRASSIREEGTYVGFWVDFFESNPASPIFATVIRANGEKISRAEEFHHFYPDFTGLTGTSPNPWGNWATLVETASNTIRKG